MGTKYRILPLGLFSRKGRSPVVRAITGDPEVTSVAVEPSDKEVSLLIAALLRSLPIQDRRDAISMALAKAQGPVQPIVPIAAMLPADATVDVAAKMLNGMFLMTLALGGASADTSVGTVLATASAMAQGTPFASDPLSAERQNEVILAKAILEAMLLGDKDAQEVYESLGLKDALESLNATASAGTTDADAQWRPEGERIKDIYDCMQHNMPLGGDASSVVEFIRNAWNNAGPVAPKEAGRSLRVTSAADAKASVSEGVTQARAALERAKEALGTGENSVSKYQEEMQQATLEMAKLQWAKAMLEAPDSVATILAASTPNVADVTTFLQSMLGVLPAAKQTGNVSTLKSLISAIRAAVSSGGSSGEALAAMLSGEPDALSQVPESARELSLAQQAYWNKVKLVQSESSDGLAQAQPTDLLQEGAPEPQPEGPIEAADAAPATPEVSSEQEIIPKEAPVEVAETPSLKEEG